MNWQINEPKPVIECLEKAEVFLPEHVYAKMFGYIDAVDGEISGMGEVQRVGSVYTVMDIWLLKQECTGASTSIDAVSLADLRAEVYGQGRAQNGFQLWWHSHANMDTFWSGTDKSTMQMFMTDIDWMLFIVANKKRSVRARVEFKTPFPLALEDISVSVNTALEYDAEAIKREVEAKVKSPQWKAPQTGFGSGYTNYHRPDYLGGDAAHDPTNPSWWKDDDDLDPTHTGTEGERYWRQLTRKERKAVKRYANEKEPFCTHYTCQICKRNNYVFYVKHLKQVICLEDVLRIIKAADKHIRITHATAPVELSDLKKPETPPTQPGINEQGDVK